MILEMVKTYVPTAITECPVPKGLYEYKVIIDSEKLLDPKLFYWGNFYPPSGLYKFKVSCWTTEDPTGVWVEWTVEIKPKKGEMSTAEW
jgi:hypothetical protein